MSKPSTLSRRNLFKATALSAGVLAAPQLLVRAAQAEVPMAAAQPAAFKRFSLGDFEVTVLSDGHRIVPGPNNIFGTNASEEEVSELLETNYLPVDKMQFTFAPTLVNTGADLILFDTGNGEGGREGASARRWRTSRLRVTPRSRSAWSSSPICTVITSAV